jgi:hypothetical protein
MRTNLFMTLFFFGLVTSQVHASVTCVAKNKQVAPPANERTYTEDGIEKDHQVWKDWKNAHTDWALRKDWGCCDGLDKQADRTCKDPSMIDDTLVSCTNDSQCSDNKGCFPLSEDDMFSTESDDPAVIAAMDLKEQQFEDQQDLIEEPKAENAICFRDMECESYNCENNRCKTKFVCRYGEPGETANGNVQCEEPLVKGGGNVCGEDTPPTFFTALLNGVTVTPVQGKQCEFQLAAGNANDEEIRGAAYLGITTMRAAEWLFATTSIGNHEDCTYGIRWMRENIQGYVTERKELLKQFSNDYVRLETEFAKIQAAKPSTEDPQAAQTQMESPCGETTTAHDIATRKATGLDYLCFLQRRNEVFMGYEAKMQELAAKFLTTSTKYDTIWGTDKNAKSWMIGDLSRSYDNLGKCRSGKKKKIKKRWGNRYKVKGTHNINKGIFDFDMVNKYMTAISDANAKNSFTKKHFMLDPIMPGGWNQGVNFENFGSGGDRRRKLHGSSGLKTIRDAQFPKIVDFYKALRSGEIAAGSFLYEPEMPDMYEQRGCLEKIESPECSKMKEFVTNVQDAAMAQMMAYSRHYKRKYKKFFDEDVWRKKLFKRYSTDFTNMGQYYGATVQYREKQNECYQKVINGINNNYGGATGGIATGEGQNYYNSTAQNYMNGSSSETDYNKNKSKKPGIRPFAIDLSVYSKSFSHSSNKDGQASNTTGSGAKFDSAYSGSFAASAKKMTEANAALEKKTGRTLADAEKDIKKSIASSAFAVGGSKGAAFSGSGSGSGAGFGNATLGDAKLSDGDLQKTDVMAAIPPAGGSAAAGAGGPGGVIGGMGSGSDSSASGSGYSDPTGMSDEEKDMMQANLDRNKSEYKTNEDDSLFQVLSKTYQRNLKRILTRKGEAAKENQNSE